MAAWTAMFEGAGPEFQQQSHDLFTYIQSIQSTDAARDRWGDRISDLTAFRVGQRDRAYRAAETFGREE